MASDPGAILRAYLEAGDRNDLAAVATFLHPEVIVHGPGGMTTVGSVAQASTWAAAHAGLSALRHEVTELIAQGEVAAARVEVTGVHSGEFLRVAATGARLQVDQAVFAHVHDGLIVQLWEIADTGRGLQQLGVGSGQPLNPGS